MNEAMNKGVKNPEEAVDQGKLQIAEDIMKMLQENDMAIQPYLKVTEHGIMPDARLVRMKMKDEPQGEVPTESAESNG